MIVVIVFQLLFLIGSFMHWVVTMEMVFWIPLVEEQIYFFFRYRLKAEYSRLFQVERYNPETDQWTILDSRMNEERSNFGAAVLNGKLFVCGGSRIALPFNPLNSVEVYDPAINRYSFDFDAIRLILL